jgi:hypothetical protein
MNHGPTTYGKKWWIGKSSMNNHNKIYVYGCSFSEPFQIEQGGAQFDHHGWRDFKGYDYWGTLLADRLNMECRTKSLSGIGWNYINNRIDEDIHLWQAQDIIIISPSFFSRVTFEELVKHDSQSELAHLMREWKDIHNHNESRWRRKVATLQQLNYSVFTWLVDHSEHSDTVEGLITADGHTNWKTWMDLHKEYWQDPTTNRYPQGDWHFNEQGHQAVAAIMYEYICRQLL